GEKWGDRFGEGVLKGRRAMIVTTAGGRAAHYEPRGINGFIDDLLWPIQHGIFFYPGMDVLPPFVSYEIGGRTSEADVEIIKQRYRERLLNLRATPVISYRSQNGGDYDETQRLKHERESNESTGLAIHQAQPVVASYGGATGIVQTPAVERKDAD
ncbi:MAG: flavodoxin family protein, partial [Proteobacteria bacterium]